MPARTPGVGTPPALAGVGHRDAVEAEPLPQLVGGLAGEGADQGVIGIGAAVPDAAGGPKGEDPGLAGTGAGDDAQRLGRRLDRLALAVCEIGHGAAEGVVTAPGGTGRRRRRLQWFHGR